ncbi:MAG: NAD(P)-binding domain-containing protein [Phycisphaerales bacterium]|jgi:thioredoxin reductase (NADPH)|nr:NAD(P)-binding domain-containing protein [Phycisphaerales bacterium]
MDPLEVLIVGAGPIGLEVAWHLQEAGVRTRVVDAGGIGQTIATHFPPATRFFSSPERLAIAGMAVPVPTQEKITGEEYLAYLRAVVLTRGIEVDTYQRVTAAEPAAAGWQVTLSDPCGRERAVHARRVVLACGGTHRPRRLGIPGEDLPHVHTWLGDPHRFFQRRVLVVGGRNSAVESALRCWRVNADVSLSYRGDAISERVKYWLRPEVQSLIDEGRIAAHPGTTPVEITPEHVTLRRGDQTTRVPVDDVLLQIGFEQDDTLMRLFGARTSGPQQAPEFNPATLETTAPDVYVAGTAIAGTQQRFKAYIETSHDHGPRIAAAVTGAEPPEVAEARVLPES